MPPDVSPCLQCAIQADVPVFKKCNVLVTIIFETFLIAFWLFALLFLPVHCTVHNQSQLQRYSKFLCLDFGNLSECPQGVKVEH